MKTICGICSHERYAGLVNAIASIRRHFPVMDILVVDDGSSDTRIAAWCEDRLSKAILVHFHVRTGPKPKGTRSGGLHENMQYALDWALAQDYDLMLMMQDDVQCLRGGRDVIDEVAGFFQRCESTFFLQSRFSKRGEPYVDRYPYYDEGFDAYRLRRACNDVGFFSLARLRNSGFRFGRDERDSAEIAGKLGFHGYQMVAPVLMDIPLRADNRWQIVMGKADSGFGDPPHENAPVLRDLTPEDISHLRARDRRILPFAEDYMRRSDGNDILFPYCIRNNPAYYAKTFKETYKREKASSSAPIPVPARSEADTDGVSERAVTRTGNCVPGVLAEFWRAAMRRSRYISIIDTISGYIHRKLRVLIFFYLEYPRIRRWFLDSSRKPDAG